MSDDKLNDKLWDRLAYRSFNGPRILTLNDSELVKEAEELVSRLNVAEKIMEHFFNEGDDLEVFKDYCKLCSENGDCEWGDNFPYWRRKEMSDDCSRYLIDEPDEDAPMHTRLCRCPICKGFLPQYFPFDKPFTCKKCGTELMTFPDVDDEDGRIIDYMGRICPISKEGKKVV